MKIKYNNLMDLHACSHDYQGIHIYGVTSEHLAGYPIAVGVIGYILAENYITKGVNVIHEINETAKIWKKKKKKKIILVYFVNSHSSLKDLVMNKLPLCITALLSYQ